MVFDVIKKDELRTIPLTEEFMKNKKIYDKIWAYLQLHSYVNSEGQRFVYKSVVDNKKQMYEHIISEQSGDEKAPFSYKTFLMSFNLLLEPTEKQIKEYENETDINKKNKLLDNLPIGYLVPGKIKIKDNKKEVDCFFIKSDFREKKLWHRSIDKDTLEYLFATSNNHVIKIYAYLKFRYHYTKNINQSYCFTKKELSEAVGYTSKSFNRDLDYILESLESCGLIEYSRVKEQVSKTTYTFRYCLWLVRDKRTNQKKDDIFYNPFKRR